ncbi:MAG: hypothetical protein FWE17_02425, partial [Alphaproteobacteria bacterium]|nr:hypothetical protein [Alphaproteobacteria bacterium]
RNNFGTWPLRVNHYQSKSWEEFAKKKARGSASPVAHADNHFRVDKNQVLVRLYSREWFDRLDTNDVKDSIMDKHIAKLKNICPV